MSVPYIHISQSSPVSGRARDFLSEINRVAADPNLGASLEQIENGMKEFSARGLDAFTNDDLVERLIEDNQVLWNQLLSNPFCMKMKAAAASDKDVLSGFDWYMRQDFLYCVKLITYEATRAPKSLNSTEFAASTKRVKSNADYSTAILNTCMAQQPSGLGLQDSVVLGTVETDALKSYTNFQVSVANTTNWVLSMVAMVPCIQSYYQIAEALKTESVHKDTLWYNLWVLENAKYKDSTVRQRNFFVQNTSQWKNQYNKANEIFREACQGEINLWATALKPGKK